MKEILEKINTEYDTYITYVDRTTGIPTDRIITTQMQQQIIELLNNDKTTNSK